MPFPEVERVIFQRNLLDQVICQLRFPPILKVDAEIPAQFQERIRRDFPNFSEQGELTVEVPPGMKPIPPEVLKNIIQSSGNKNYEFSSEDGTWKVNLTRTFVALSTNKYERWTGFKEKLVVPLTALAEIYHPTYFSRIGLRYIDVIRRSSLNLNGVDWSELLQPYILGILSDPNIGTSIQTFESKYEMRLDDGESSVRVVTSFVQPANDNEICYKIDSDFHNDTKNDVDSAMRKLDYFNIRGFRLIRWCMTNRLQQAMEPHAL
jgi:uncharacterized protein (TIGR04255 family)